MDKKVNRVKKRDGKIVSFKAEKIKKAIYEALRATKENGEERAEALSGEVVDLINREFEGEELISVENIQDCVEKVLIRKNLFKAAKAYILYREQHRKLREMAQAEEEGVDKVDQYLRRLDWEVKENANMSYSLQGLNNYVAAHLVKRYWLEKVYPEEIRRAERESDLHIHDLQTLGAYCAGWDLYELLTEGFGGVKGKIQSKPPKHFKTALGQIVNFLYTVQGEVAGAVAFSNFDTLLAPFIRVDHLSYRHVKQAMQEFLFNMNVPTRVGFQTPFTNITLDISPSPLFADQSVVIGGEPQDFTYGDFQEEMNMLNKALYEVMIEGDAQGRVFTFPIPTINITDDFPWEKKSLEPMWEATAKYGINYFGNYLNSDMDPKDIRSMCCRLQINKKELYNRGGGGLFGAGSLTGSIGVVTLNMPRIGYLSENKKEFLSRVGELMELSKESLEIKRKTVENFTEKGLYPYCKHWLSSVKKMRGGYWDNHFSTIGLVGMNEAVLNFMGKDIGTRKGRAFTKEVMDFMRDKLLEYQKETGNLYNLEASPAEGTSYRLALKDKEKYPDIITSGTEETPYYTNSTQLPVDYTDDVFKALDLQDDIQAKYTGGTVQHLYLGEKIDDPNQAKKLVRSVFEEFELPYISLTPTFSVCPTHGYLSGEHFECPKCTIKQPCEVYSRIVGYLRPVGQWNDGKRQEFAERREYKHQK